MICKSTGDPHVTTFSGHRCNLHGLGVFPLVELPDVKAQTFHCPATRVWNGASTIAGVAIRIGNDVVTIIGGEVSGNGAVLSGSSGVVGGLTVTTPSSNKVRVETASGMWLESQLRSTGNIPVGYLQNVKGPPGFGIKLPGPKVVELDLPLGMWAAATQEGAERFYEVTNATRMAGGGLVSLGYQRIRLTNNHSNFWGFLNW